MSGALTALAAALAVAVPMPADPVVERSLQLARAQWLGQVPDCPDGGLQLYLYDDPGGKAERADMPGCRLFIDREFRRTADPVAVCSIVAHGYGHTLGWGHSNDPDDVMFPGLSFTRRCERVFMPERAPRRARHRRGDRR